MEQYAHRVYCSVFLANTLSKTSQNLLNLVSKKAVLNFAPRVNSEFPLSTNNYLLSKLTITLSICLSYLTSRISAPESHPKTNKLSSYFLIFVHYR